jgi:1-pyrroline-5-carboxylate dehydrogenase
MKEETFGPVLKKYIYNDNEYEETLKLRDQTSSYELTWSAPRVIQ